MQLPTCVNTRIRSTQDAHKIFYAIQRGVLHMVTRRLDADERLALRSGCIYAWEERGPNTEMTGLGIERFTEGRRWSPSRVRDEFLFYYEKYSPQPNAYTDASGGPPQRPTPNEHWDALVKQTYSVWVETEKGRRKWHLTAYFSHSNIDNLQTIDVLPHVRDLDVPQGIFQSTRTNKTRKGDEQGDSSKSGPSRTYAAFPASYQNSQDDEQTQPVLMYDPYKNSHSGPSTESSSTHDRMVYHPSKASLPYPESTRAGNEPFISGLNLGSVSPTSQFQGYAMPYATSLPRVGHELPLDSLESMSFGPNRGAHSASPSASDWSSSSNNTSERHAFFHNGNDFSGPLSLTHGLSGNISVPPSGLTFPFPGSDPVPQVVAHSSPSPRYDSRAQLCGDISDQVADGLPRLRMSDDLPFPPPEVSPSGSEEGDSGVGPRRSLAPLHSLIRPQPYRREPLDERTLRLLKPRST